MRPSVNFITFGRVERQLESSVKSQSIRKKDVKSRLAKQARWHAYIPLPKEVNSSHYKVTKPYEQHQFDLLYVPHNVFERNTYKYILTGVDVASRYKKIVRVLNTKKASKVAFVLDVLHGKGDVFKYHKVF